MQTLNANLLTIITRKQRVIFMEETAWAQLIADQHPSESKPFEWVFTIETPFLSEYTYRFLLTRFEGNVALGECWLVGGTILGTYLEGVFNSRSKTIHLYQPA